MAAHSRTAAAVAKGSRHALREKQQDAAAPTAPGLAEDGRCTPGHGEPPLPSRQRTEWEKPCPKPPPCTIQGFSVRNLPEQVGTAFRIHRTAFRNPGHDYGGSQASVILPGPAPCGHQAAGLPVLHNRFIIISALSGIHSHTGLHRFSPPDVQDAADFGETVPASSVTLRVSATRTPPPMSHGA